MSFMYNIAVMGDWDSIYGFGALGLSAFPVHDEKEAAKTFRKLSGGGYAVIYITEALADILSEEIEKVSENPIPAVILIPGISGNTGKGIENVRKSVEKAVGSDIIFND